MIGAFEPPAPPLRAITPQPRTIIIVEHSDNHYDVHVGEAVSNLLGFDEMLAEVARLALGHVPRYMQHVEALIAHLERSAARRTERAL